MLVAFSAIAVLALAIFHAVRLGQEGERVARVKAVMEGWSLSPMRDAEMQRSLAAAAREVPFDPAPLELEAVLAVRRGGDDAAAETAINEAKRAATLRPSSPYTWAALVSLQYRIGGTGDEFEAALRNASELGPSEAEVERAVLDYGLAVWSEVAPRTREAVEAAVTRAMQRDPGETLRLAAKRGRLAVACRHLPSREDKRWMRTCRSTEARS